MRVANRIAALPGVYDLIQHALGDQHTVRRITPMFQRMAGATVADLGAGTGYWAHLIPSSAQYIWTDVDPVKLASFQAKRLPAFIVMTDGANIGLKTSGVDYTTVIGVSHHLRDEALAALLKEAARITRQGFLFLDAVLSPNLWRSRLLWRYDLGHYPRTVDTLRAAIRRNFVIEHEELYVVHHRYFLCLARPDLPQS